MILSNVELQRALDEGRLAISPEPAPRFPSLENPHCPYDTHSVDLHLADEIVVPNREGVPNRNPSQFQGQSTATGLPPSS
ncbi:MAG: hypothetical protein WD045_06005 [Pirellulaceae bacterium]